MVTLLLYFLAELIKIVNSQVLPNDKHGQITPHHHEHSLGAMPFPKLTCCYEEPMYPEMAVIQKEIYQNLAPISLPYGNGHGGFLGVMMPEVLYAQRFNDSFQLPHNPPASTLMTFPPMHPSNNGVNSSSTTKQQNRCTKPSKW